MKIISENQIKDLGITPATCVDWGERKFLYKKQGSITRKNKCTPPR